MPSKTMSALVGGLAGGLLVTVITLPQNDLLNCLACLMYAGCGLIAVWHYTDTNELTISGGEGVKLGALAGVVGGLVVGILAILFRAIGVLPGAEDIMREMEESGALDQMGEMADFWISFIEFTAGPGSILIGIPIAAVISLAGGAIGAALFKKGRGEDDVVVTDDA